MDLLADQTFPASIQLSALPHLRVGRWSNEFLTDTELVELAGREGFQGVLFLGPAALYDGDLRATASRARVALLATSESDPISAATAVASNLHAIARVLKQDALLMIYAREVREFNLD